MDRTVPPGAAILLDFIGKIEAPKGYGTIYGNNQGKLSKPLTSMTLGEVIKSGSSWTKAYKSSAAGRYQFMNATLRGLKTELGLSDGQIFDADLQDRLGFYLLKRRGYNDFMSGKSSDVQFALNLAKEWASFPVLAAIKGGSRNVERGQSYYAGDGLNKALVKPEAIEALLVAARKAENTFVPPQPAPPDIPAPKPIAQPSKTRGVVGWAIVLVIAIAAVIIGITQVRF